MLDEMEYQCFVGNLSWKTSDRSLKDAFNKFGHLLDAKVVVDKVSGRSRGFGFVTYDEKKAMEDAIEDMDGIDLDGRNISVDKAQPNSVSGRDNDRSRDRNRKHGRGSNGGGDCFKCGKPGHFARECPGEGSRGSRYGGRDDRYGGGGGGRSHYGPSRTGDRESGRSRDGSRGGDRYNRDRYGPYEH